VSPRAISLRFTTTPGLEDIVARELGERLSGGETVFGSAASAGIGAETGTEQTRQNTPDFEIETKPLDLDGHAMLHTDAGTEELRSVVFALRSCFHVIRHVAFLPMQESEPLEALTEDLGRIEIPEMRSAGRFRVTSQRTGDHAFGSMDVQRVAGAALVERYETAVDLENFDTEVRVDAVGDTWLVGVQWTRDSLDKRYRWVYRPRVTLRTNIAYAMLRLAELPAREVTLLDPFCGSGTIPIEAAATLPQVRCLAADRDPEAVSGTRANAEAAGVAASVEVRGADARDLRETYQSASVDAVVTNPPYGIRLGRKTNYADLYRKFLTGAAYVVKPGGRVVVLVGKRRAAFNRVLREIDELRILSVRVIETGGVYPGVFVLERV
jgi:putative N6-adenine-specific DNA methylase/tRNA (guanine6-N2)-methyltransferase